jgi:L-threonylcarbamoyladenylate synthase
MLRVTTGQADFDRERVGECARILCDGGVGIIPTDTVYGIAAKASDAKAVARVLAIKERPADKPLPVQVASAADAESLAAPASPLVIALMERFWPGPLTIVIGKRPGVELPFQDASTIGIRVPASPLCIELIERAGFLVVPSANPPGDAAPVAATDIDGRVLAAVDFVIDSGPCPGGLESTVLGVDGALEVLRQGAISLAEILAAVREAGL